MSNAISTYRTYLGIGPAVTSSNRSSCPTTGWTKLIDVSSIPDIGQDRENIEVTTLSDSMKKYIPGIQGNENMKFEGYYDHARYAAIYAIKDTEYWYGVFFGGSGDDASVTNAGSSGAFTFTGYATPIIKGASSNEAVGMTVSITPSSVITDSTGSVTLSAVNTEFTAPSGSSGG